MKKFFKENSHTIISAIIGNMIGYALANFFIGR